MFYAILQPCIRLCPSVVYRVSNNSSFRNNMSTIAYHGADLLFWRTLCVNGAYGATRRARARFFYKCLKTLTLRFMNYVAQIIQQDELEVLRECYGLSRTLKLLGAPLAPILDTGTESQFLRLSYTYIVTCLYNVCI